MQVPFIDVGGDQGVMLQIDRRLAAIGGTAAHVADKRARETPQSGLSDIATIREGLSHVPQ